MILTMNIYKFFQYEFKKLLIINIYLHNFTLIHFIKKKLIIDYTYYFVLINSFVLVVLKILMKFLNLLLLMIYIYIYI